MAEALQKILVAVDIETSGSKFSNKVIAVGFAIGDTNGKLMETKQFNLEVSLDDFEKRCYDEFWSHHLDKLAEFKENAMSQDVGWKAIAAYIDQLENLGTLKFLSDNASFDLAFINYNLEKYCDRLPMRYSSKGKFRSVVAPDDMLNMLPKNHLEKVLKSISSKAPADHNPVNDAINIYYQYIAAIEAKAEIAPLYE